MSTTTRNTEPLGFPIKSEVMFNETGRYQGRYNTNIDHNSGQRIRGGYYRTRRGNYNSRDNVGNITKCSRCGSIYHWANRFPSSSRGTGITGHTLRRGNRRIEDNGTRHPEQTPIVMKTPTTQNFNIMLIWSTMTVTSTSLKTMKTMMMVMPRILLAQVMRTKGIQS